MGVGAGRDGSVFQVLADLVRPFGRSDHRRHTSASSSGVAAHTSLSEARASDVAELIERDAFMRAWLSGRPATRVLHWESSAPASFVGPLVESGWTVDLIQIAPETTQPVLVALARRGRQIALGSSSGTPEVALDKSLTELWSTATSEPEIAAAPQRPEDVASPRDHALFALAGRHSAIPDFLRSSDREIAFADFAPELAWPEELNFYEWNSVSLGRSMSSGRLHHRSYQSRSATARSLTVAPMWRALSEIGSTVARGRAGASPVPLI